MFITKMKTVLCILTLNELECLKEVFPNIPKPGKKSGYDEIYAIDGGSTDGTLEYFEKNKIKIVTQDKRGRGNAFLQAFKKIKADTYIFFSPDGNEDISDLSKFRKYVEAGADLVIASRMMKGAYNEEDAQLIKPRKWANLSFNLMANLSFRRKGPYVTDSINGYRAITSKMAKELSLDAHGYTIEYQMTMRALKKGANIVEFPTREGQRISGEIQAKSIPTGLKFIKCYCTELLKKA